VNPVEEIGAKSPIDPPTVTPETIATICYTSVRPPLDIYKPKLRIHVASGNHRQPKGCRLDPGRSRLSDVLQFVWHGRHPIRYSRRPLVPPPRPHLRGKIPFPNTYRAPPKQPV